MEKKGLSINIFLILVLLGLAFMQVFMLNKYSTAGGELSDLSKQIEEINSENGRLSRQIASSSAIAIISQEAEKLGLSKSPNLVSLNIPLPVAYSLGSSL